MFRHLSLVSVAFSLCVSQAVAASARTWEPQDMQAAVLIDDVRISPDGISAILAVSRADVRANSIVTHQRLVRLSDGTSTALPDDLSQPRWSPRGDRIAWLAADPKGPARLTLTDARGRRARTLSHGTSSVLTYSWSPDGTRLAAIESAAAATSKPPRFAWLGAESDYRNTTPPTRDVYLIDPATGSQRKLTHDSWSYGGPVTDHDPSWSADGRQLAVVRQPTPRYGDFEHEQYVRLALGDGSVTQIVAGPFFAYPGSTPPLFAPAGASLAYAHSWDGKLPSREDLYVDARDVSAGLDRDLWSCGAGTVEWQPHALVALLMDQYAMRLFRLDETGGAPLALTPESGSVEAFSLARSGRIAYAYSTPAAQPELFVLDPGGAPRQITHLGNLHGLPLAATRDVAWQTSDGHTLHGQLTLPPGAHVRDVPLIVEPHGGPQCADDSSFDPFGQFVAAHGYAFFRPNPRGSDGYGDWSYKAIVGDWGAGPMADDLAGVDAVLASGVSNERSLYLEGASYGGYLTAWITTHSNRFKAAAAQVPVTNLLLEYTLSESPNIMRRFFGERPAADRDLLARESPLTYAAAERTPLLLTIGLRDTRAPYPQAIEFFKTVAENGGETRLLADSLAGHGPDDPRGTMLWAEATLSWFADHGAPRIPGVAMPQ
jgi:dipeptidyl aminopeptidase/acylaminoacyl peptidase